MKLLNKKLVKEEKETLKEAFLEALRFDAHFRSEVKDILVEEFAK